MTKNNYNSTVSITQELANNPAVQMAQQLANNPVAQMAQQLANNPAVQMAQELANNPAVQMAQELANNPVAQQLANNPAVQMAQQLANNPAVQMAQELANNPAVQMAQELANNPVVQMAQQLANNPAVQIVQEWVNDNSLQAQFQTFIHSNVFGSDFISNFYNYINNISDLKNQESLLEKLVSEDLLLDKSLNDEPIPETRTSKSSIKIKKLSLSDVLNIISILITVLLWYIGQLVSQPTEEQAQKIIECLSVLSSQQQTIIELMEASQESESSPAGIQFEVATPGSAWTPDSKSPVASDSEFDNSESLLKPLLS